MAYLDMDGLTTYDALIKAEITSMAYTLPTASTTTLGGVKVDGTTITISDGVISAAGGGGSPTAMTEQEVSDAVDAGWVTQGNDVTISLTNPRYASSAATPACKVYGATSESYVPSGDPIGTIDEPTGAVALVVDESLYGVVVDFSANGNAYVYDTVTCTGDVTKTGVQSKRVLLKVDGPGTATIDGVNYDW